VGVRALVSVVWVSGLLAAACGAPQEQTEAELKALEQGGSADVTSTDEVLTRHMETFGNSDMEGILADYAPDAVIFTPNGAVRGTAEIRQMFEGMFAEWGQPGTTFELKQRIVDGRFAFIFWSAETAQNRYEGTMDGFVVENGKIVTQFFAGHITPKAAQK
jgi:ketosteroid isomerase-like protein